MFKLSTYIITTLVLIFVSILTIGNYYEQGDINAVSMYPVVYLIPCVILWFGISIIMYYMSRLRNNYLFVVLSIILFGSVILINEYSNIRGFEIYRIILILCFAFNVLYFELKRIKDVN
jgi:hypothetical protein